MRPVDAKDKKPKFSDRLEALRNIEHTPARQMIGALIMGALFISVALLMIASAPEPLDAANSQLIMAGVLAALGVAFVFAKPHKQNPRRQQVAATDPAVRVRYVVITVLLALLGLIISLDW